MSGFTAAAQALLQTRKPFQTMSNISWISTGWSMDGRRRWLLLRASSSSWCARWLQSPEAAHAHSCLRTCSVLPKQEQPHGWHYRCGMGRRQRGPSICSAAWRSDDRAPVHHWWCVSDSRLSILALSTVVNSAALIWLIARPSELTTLWQSILLSA